MSSTVFTPFSEKELIPQEERLEVVKKKGKFCIGIPKETRFDEKRLCLTPDAVQVLTEAGHQIMMEKGAGEGSYYTDLQYSEAGAEITEDRKKVFGQELVIKISPPSVEDLAWVKPNAYLISALPINLISKEYIKILFKKRINAIAFEYIVDEYKQKSLTMLIGEIVGTTSILYASELLATTNGLMLSGITGVRPTEVVVIGAGTVGQYATKAALGLSASVRVFDNSIYKLRRLHSNINDQVSTSIVDPKELGKALRRADVVIGALPRVNLWPVVTEAMVGKMKRGSVIIDVTVDSGKCVETSELTSLSHPTVVKHGVVHCGIPNLAARIPRTTTKAISNFFLSYLLDIEQQGGFENMLKRNYEFKQGFYMYKGRLTQEVIARRFGLPAHDINLLIF